MEPQRSPDAGQDGWGIFLVRVAPINVRSGTLREMSFSKYWWVIRFDIWEDVRA